MYATSGRAEELRSIIPRGRVALLTGVSRDVGIGAALAVGNLVEFLVTDNGDWIRGQDFDAEGGFSRSKD